VGTDTYKCFVLLEIIIHYLFTINLSTTIHNFKKEARGKYNNIHNEELYGFHYLYNIDSVTSLGRIA
jgi:hypothetical protein